MKKVFWSLLCIGVCFFYSPNLCSAAAKSTSSAKGTGKGVVVTTTVKVVRGSDFCISKGTGCTITATITVNSSKHSAVATFDKFGSEYDGRTIDDFQFTVNEDGVNVTYDVPTQVLHWSDAAGGFVLVCNQI